MPEQVQMHEDADMLVDGADDEGPETAPAGMEWSFESETARGRLAAAADETVRRLPQ